MIFEKDGIETLQLAYVKLFREINNGIKKRTGDSGPLWLCISDLF